MKIVFISYNYLPQYTSPQQWINRIKPSVVIMEVLSKDNSVGYVKQIGYTGNYKFNGVDYCFLNPGKKLRLPNRLHCLVKKLKPDVVIVPGFHFPLQVIQLRLILGRKVKIILEHHADKPFKGIKKNLQKIADRFIDAYNFTSLGNAQEWLDAKIISNKKKCYEIPANSSYFLRLNKQKCKQQLGMTADVNFLWVGRLEKNKDPITVLKGFEKFIANNSSFHLHMFYQTEELLPAIKKIINENSLLQQTVFLHGRIENKALENWYSAADFYISASHKESFGIALVEAMSCGCIPIVTEIPASLKLVENGKYGLHYQPGNPEQLYAVLKKTNTINKEILSQEVENHFIETLSPTAITKEFYFICKRLLEK